MHAVAQITQPGSQRRCIILVDNVGIADNRGSAGDGCPGGSCRIKEGHVDFFGMYRKIQYFAREETGVEKQIDATGFLIMATVVA